MWTVNGKDLCMCEGDWGIELPLVVNGIKPSGTDGIKLTIKTEKNETVLLEKNFTNITKNTINLKLTEQETEQLPVGKYVYSIDWYQNGSFRCNIIPFAIFKVIDKA